jgi:hypothetical protein
VAVTLGLSDLRGVLSMTDAHREAFAREMSGELKIPIKVADSAEARRSRADAGPRA